MCDLRDKYKYYCQWFLFECTTNTYFGTGSYVIALVIVLSSVTRAANETLTNVSSDTSYLQELQARCPSICVLAGNVAF